MTWLYRTLRISIQERLPPVCPAFAVLMMRNIVRRYPIDFSLSVSELTITPTPCDHQIEKPFAQMVLSPVAKARANGVLRNCDLRFAVRWPMIGTKIVNNR